MKLCLVLALFVCCALAQKEDPKEQLLKRVAELETRVKGTIQKLKDERRSHLAQGIQEEADRLQKVADELKSADDLKPDKLKHYEDKLIRIATRLSFEEMALNREMQEQDKILADANKLEAWAQEQIKTMNGWLEKVTEDHVKKEIEEGIKAIEHETKKLRKVIEELEKADDIERIAGLEVETRAIEGALAEILSLVTPHMPTNAPNTI